MNSLPAQSLPAQLAIPQDATLVDWDTARVDGVEFRIAVRYQPAEPQNDVPAPYFDWDILGTPKLVDRAEWDAAHAPIQPTANVLRYMVRHDRTVEMLERAMFARMEDDTIAAVERMAEGMGREL